jgi:hypothetical protein
MSRVTTSVCVVLLVCAVTGAAEAEFTLDLYRFQWPLDPRTEARLADWNSPIGRVAHEVAMAQGSLGRTGLPGGNAGVALRFKLQGGLAPDLITAVVADGVSLDQRSLTVIRWPWTEPAAKQPLDIDQQMSLLLGRRLEVR